MKKPNLCVSKLRQNGFWRKMAVFICCLSWSFTLGESEVLEDCCSSNSSTPTQQNYDPFTDILKVSNTSELSAAIDNVLGGEIILLASGEYGALSISNRSMPTEVTVMAALNAIPEFSSVNVSNSSSWRLSGLHVKPRFTSGADTNSAVRIVSSDIIFENSEVNYAEDTSGWSANDWVNRTGNGIVLGGTRLTVRRNRINNVDHAIASDATHSLIAHNTIDGFRGDACRSLGDYVTFEYNIGKNAVRVDDNHDDFFQSWSNGTGGVGTGEVVGVILRGNTLISYEDENQPFKTIPQGIGLFDGMFRDWIIENNVIITGHWHGISMYGAIDSRIVNNTVIDRDYEDTPTPWIQIVNHPNGTSSQNCFIRNNLTPDVNMGTGVTSDNNLIVADPTLYYVSPEVHDLHLLEDSPAVDAGSTDLAAAIDKDGIERPQGDGIDTGAYEWVVPITDTDGDSLPDDWEMTRIGHLDHKALDDTDGDKHTNLFELAAGSDPSIADSENFVNAFLEPAGDYRLLNISYRRSTAMNSLGLTVEFSGNMVDWEVDPGDGSMTDSLGMPTQNGDGTETVHLRYRTPLSNHDKIFVRINAQ